jgi:hypothetical protein
MRLPGTYARRGTPATEVTEADMDVRDVGWLARPRGVGRKTKIRTGLVATTGRFGERLKDRRRRRLLVAGLQEMLSLGSRGIWSPQLNPRAGSPGLPPLTKKTTLLTSLPYHLRAKGEEGPWKQKVIAWHPVKIAEVPGLAHEHR